MSKRDDPSGDMAKIAKHLERSNKPSALMMLMLKDMQPWAASTTRRRLKKRGHKSMRCSTLGMRDSVEKPWFRLEAPSCQAIQKAPFCRSSRKVSQMRV
eukprot:360238-Amphidinium_carterae.1